MTIPRVTRECTIAVMEKSTQQDFGHFALEITEELLREQPDLLAAISFLLTNFLTSGMESEEVEAAQTAAGMAVVGVVYRMIKSQMAAAEMESLFSEEETVE